MIVSFAGVKQVELKKYTNDYPVTSFLSAFFVLFSRVRIPTYFPMSWPSTCRTLLIETLMEDVKAIIIENSGIKDRDRLNLFACVLFLHYQGSDGRNKIDFFLLSSPSKELSFEPLMQKLKLVVLDFFEFENRDMLLWIAVLACSACQDREAYKLMIVISTVLS